MKNFLPLAIALLFVAPIISAQHTDDCKVSFRKYPLTPNGTQAYFPTPIGEVTSSESPDKSLVYTVEITHCGIKYGIVAVELNAPIAKADAESTLIAYLDYLKKAYEIKSAAGYGKGHTLTDYPNVLGVIDYWADEIKQEWKVKGWTDGKRIGVLYVVHPPDLVPNENYMELFLNGYRPPME